MQRNETSVDPSRTHHLDGAPQTVTVAGGNVKLIIQELARRFRPFNVPPAPTPISDADISAAEAEASAAAEADAKEEMQAKRLEMEVEQQEYDPYIQEVIINVPQDSDLQNGGFFTSHGAPMIEMENPVALQEIENPVFGRGIGRRRSVGYPAKRRPGMYAISVKRQRRLKMKKHKYKKLMRKTRNLRRKLGQI